jgi:hypothetical protein
MTPYSKWNVKTESMIDCRVTGDTGDAKADQVSGYKLKDLLATNPFEDFETSDDEGADGWASDVKPSNERLEAPPAIIASVMAPASQAHGAKPGGHALQCACIF